MNELPEQDRNNRDFAIDAQVELLAAAREAQFAAYCPYSNFSVGAAVLTSDGSIFTGCNVENASYGLTICAERVALFSAVAAGQLDIAAIAVVTSANEIARPCGACRQVMAEFSKEQNSIVVISSNESGDTVFESINDLLPSQFNLL